MTSVVRFEEWQEPTGITAATTDSSGNVTFDNDVTVSGGATVSGDLTVTGNMTSANQGLTLVRSVTPDTNVSSVTVSNVFSNDFRNYKILYFGGYGSTISALNLTLGSSSTAYYWAYSYISYSGSTVTNSGNNVSNFTNVGEISATNGNMMDCDIYGPNIAKPTAITWHMSGQSVNLWGAGRHGPSSQYTSFTLTPSSGTLSAGLLQVYGYNNGA